MFHEGSTLYIIVACSSNLVSSDVGKVSPLFFPTVGVNDGGGKDTQPTAV